MFKSIAIWLVVALVLMTVFNQFNTRQQLAPQSQLDYSQFLEEVKQGHITKVTIEGHSDERGSSEYNLALGERRARVTRDFLVAAGIEANRVNTISFGKERPFVLGHDESAWKWNRRAHFTLSTK